MDHGYFVISLDFELTWGVFDTLNGNINREYFTRTRSIVPEILQIFDQNNIECTWATVGMLFNRNWEEWEENIPQKVPAYSNSILDAYKFGRITKDQEAEELFFAPELIKEVMQVQGQEIASHTYSHYYSSVEGQTREEFKADLEKALEVAKKFGINIRSLVFPRNQLNNSYLKDCYKLGITSVRSNPANWFWKNPNSENLITKIFRTGEAYNIFSPPQTYSLESLKKEKNLPLRQPASRFLRPYESNSVLRNLKMKRIFNEMTQAAKRKEVYHLWWHPHNFGQSPKESIKELQMIISLYKILKSKYDFSSANMNTIYNEFLK